jgi:hypothetical protein
VLIQIVKGLYLHETGHRLPSTHCVVPYDEPAILHSLQIVTPPPAQDFSLFPTLIREVENTPRRTIGSIFAYTVLQIPSTALTPCGYIEHSRAPHVVALISAKTDFTPKNGLTKIALFLSVLP